MNVASPRYREALDRGVLTLPYCATCRSWSAPWVFLCPTDYRHAVEFRAVEPRGSVRTWATYRREYPLARRIAVPYTVAQIDLEQGVRICALRGAGDAAPMRLGAPVALSIVRDNGPSYPVFSLVENNNRG